MKNDASIYQSQLEDFYKVSENINGVTTWVSYSKAIWYVPMADAWVIGDLIGIGTKSGEIFSYGSIGRRFNCPFEATNDIEFFNHDKNIFEPDISEDVSIHCIRDPPPPTQSPMQGNLKNVMSSLFRCTKAFNMVTR